MLNDIHVFLHDHKWWCVAATVVAGIVFARILIAHLQAGAAPAPARPADLGRPPGKPSAKFAETVRAEDIPKARGVDAGVAGHIEKGRAQTDKMAPVTVGGGDDAAMADLFSGLPGEDADAKAKDETTKRGTTLEGSSAESGARRRIGRMEELGFHRTIPSEKVEPIKAPDFHTGNIAPTGLSAPSPAAAPATDAPKAAAPELDAILARIDQVLAQDNKKTEVADAPKADAPAAEAPKADARTRPTEMLPPSPAKADPKTQPTQVLTPVVPGEEKPASGEKKAPPLWARADAFDEDADKKGEPKKDAGKQLGLFDQNDK